MSRAPAPPDPIAALRAHLWREFEPEIRAMIAEETARLRAEFAVKRGLLTAREAARHLGIGVNRFAALARSGAIPAVVVDNRRRYVRAELDAWAATLPRP